MADEQQPRLRAQVMRALVSSGLSLFVVLLMAISGAASITLLYFGGSFVPGMRGFEGSVVSTVLALEPLINLVHELGGYAAFVFAGWAGVEMFALARMLRRSDQPALRAAASRVMLPGVSGAVLLACSIALLTFTGVKAAGFNHSQQPLAATPTAPGSEKFTSAEGDELVNWHTRELTYILALGALLLAAGASQARKAAPRKPAAKEESPPAA